LRERQESFDNEGVLAEFGDVAWGRVLLSGAEEELDGVFEDV
jgi:hypothetical protein